MHIGRSRCNIQCYTRAYSPNRSQSYEKTTASFPLEKAKRILLTYVSITADDLNIKNYPAVKSLSSSKEQVVMEMYIVTNEGKGEWFTVEDVTQLLTVLA